MDISTQLEVYELLRRHGGPEFARGLVASHADLRDPPATVYAQREDGIVGVAFCWQIEDPHDVEEKYGYPGEIRDAKYCYWPFIYVDPANREAEIAFSISRPYQKKGLGKILLNKLAHAARDNGIRGFMAYTSTQNRGMIKLFRMLPYKVDSFFDGDMLQLRCRFD